MGEPAYGHSNASDQEKLSSVISQLAFRRVAPRSSDLSLAQYPPSPQLILLPHAAQIFQLN